MFWKRRSRTQGVLLQIRLAAKLQPMHRGRYEVVLDGLFDSGAVHGALVDAGTMFDPEIGVEYSELSVGIADTDYNAALQRIFTALTEAGAPRGSWAVFPPLEAVYFGRTHGFALRLTEDLDVDVLEDGVNANSGLLQIKRDLDVRLDEARAGRVQSWWVGPEFAELYAYGEERELLHSVLENARDAMAGRAVEIIPVTE